MKRTIEQLRSQTWPSRDAAVRELKRNGLAPHGFDYKLGEHEPGVWVVVPLGDETVAPQEPAVTQLPMRPARGVKLSAQAKPVKPPVPAKATAAAKGKASAPAKAKEAAQSPPAAPAPAIDLSPVPSEDGPYVLRIAAAHVHQTSAVAEALEASRLLKRPVELLGPDGAVLRVIDHAVARAAKKAKTQGQGRAPGRKRDPNAPPNPMVAEAIALARRPEGVTREQLKAVSTKQQPWTSIIKDAAERYGYVYRTSEAKDGASRVAYHLDDKPTE